MSWRSWGLLGTRPPKHAWCGRACDQRGRSRLVPSPPQSADEEDCERDEDGVAKQEDQRRPGEHAQHVW
jgi:hypothetical protein